MPDKPITRADIEALVRAAVDQAVMNAAATLIETGIPLEDWHRILQGSRASGEALGRVLADSVDEVERAELAEMPASEVLH